MDERIANILKNSETSRIFYINKDNQFTFKLKQYRGLTALELYEKDPDGFEEFLDNIYPVSNYLDRINILSIKKELGINGKE